MNNKLITPLSKREAVYRVDAEGETYTVYQALGEDLISLAAVKQEWCMLMLFTRLVEKDGKPLKEEEVYRLHGDVFGAIAEAINMMLSNGKQLITPL